MIVVSDASVLIALSKLNRLEILPALFGSVVIPPEVLAELSDPSAPTAMPELLLGIPDWLRVQAPNRIHGFERLGAGETAAIALANELRADFLIIDEKTGRKVALKIGLPVIGTIGVLEAAAEFGLIDLAETFRQLLDIRFHVTAEFLDSRLQAFHLRQVLQAD